MEIEDRTKNEISDMAVEVCISSQLSASLLGASPADIVAGLYMAFEFAVRTYVDLGKMTDAHAMKLAADGLHSIDVMWENLKKNGELEKYIKKYNEQQEQTEIKNKGN